MPSMYLSHYNLSEKPFRIDTDPRYLWFGEKHQEALSVLKYGVLDRNGFVVLTGGIGTGKTTLLNALLESLGDDVLVANINNPKLETLDFLKIVAVSYEPTAAIGGKADFIIYFNRFLKRAHVDGKVVLLVIDEAHRLSPELLEEIRLLSNAEQAGKRLINIFFIGQNELKQSLLLPDCQALRQRVTLFYDIQPLSESEMVQYIGHRLRVAGSEAQLFTSDAIREVHRFSRGYPRLINVICERALLTGYVQGLKTISPDVVTECALEIRFPGEAGSIFEKALIDKLRARWRAAFRDMWREPSVRRVIQAMTSRWTHFAAALSTGRVFAKTGVKKEAATVGSGNTELAFKGETNAAVANETDPDGEETQRTSARFKRQTFFYGGLFVGIGIIAVALALMVQATPAEKTRVPTPTSGVAVEQGQAPPQSRTGPPLPSQPFGAENGLPSVLDLVKGALAQKNYQLALELLEATRNPERLPEFKPLYAQALAGKAARLLETSPLEAQQMLRNAIALDSKNVEAHFFLGKVYTRLKDYTQAIAAYQKAVDLDPVLSDALFNLGFLYASTGMYDSAEKMFARVVRTNPPYLDKALFNLAMVQQKLGKKEESRASLEKAVAAKPDNQKAQTYLQQFKAAEEAGR